MMHHASLHGGDSAVLSAAVYLVLLLLSLSLSLLSFSLSVPMGSLHMVGMLRFMLLT